MHRCTPAASPRAPSCTHAAPQSSRPPSASCHTYMPRCTCRATRLIITLARTLFTAHASTIPALLSPAHTPLPLTLRPHTPRYISWNHFMQRRSMRTALNIVQRAVMPGETRFGAVGLLPALCAWFCHICSHRQRLPGVALHLSWLLS